MKFILFAFCFFLQSVVLAQKKGQSLIDSVVGILPSLKNDSNKVKALSKIGETYMSVDPAKGISFVRTGLSLSENLQYQRGLSRMNNLLGLLIGDTGNNRLSRFYFNKSYEVNLKIGFPFGMISNLNNIGRSYQRESDFSSALDYFLKALAIAQDIKSNEQIALVGTNLTSSYFSQQNYAQALQYAEMTLKYAELAHSQNNIGKALLEIGNIKHNMGDTISARLFMNRAYGVYEKMGNPLEMAQVLVEKATLEYPDYQKAFAQMLVAQQILDSVGPSSIYAIGNLSNMGSACFELSKLRRGQEKSDYLNKAEFYLRKGILICRATENVEYLAAMTRTMSDLEAEKGNFKSALENFKNYDAINDSLFSQDKKNQLASLESKHQMDVKDKEIEIGKIELDSQRRTLLASLIGLLLLGIIGSLLIWQNRNRRKINTTLMGLNHQLDEANKVKLKFFGILSHDLRSPISNLVNYLYLLKNEPGKMSPEENQEGQQQIRQSAEQLLQTMEAMLLWSKEQMENYRPEIRIIPVSVFFDYIRKFFESLSTVNMTFSDPGKLEISADENYLKVIMQNLTSNAVKAIERKSDGLISWEARQNGKQIILSITDNGSGIKSEKMEQLYTGKTGTNAITGFGFHIIRDLAKAIQFSITVESVSGTGTTIAITNSPLL